MGVCVSVYQEHQLSTNSWKRGLQLTLGWALYNASNTFRYTYPHTRMYVNVECIYMWDLSIKHQSHFHPGSHACMSHTIANVLLCVPHPLLSANSRIPSRSSLSISMYSIIYRIY